MGAAALVVSAAAAAPAAPTAATASAATPEGDSATPGPGAVPAPPALVDGIREQAPLARTAADAARAHLAARKDRYRIADPERDLRPAGTLTSGGRETVRLQQTHHGVPVLGGQYLVRMERHDGRRTVTGTSGRYFTGLRTGTTAGIDDTLAVERAVDAVRRDLAARDFTAGPDDEDADTALTGTAHGLVVIPNGTGVLTRHITVRGTGPAGGGPVLREVYIDARAGYPVLQYSGIRTFAPSAPAPGPAARAALADGPAPDGTTGSGVRLDGTTVPLAVTHDDTRDAYVLRDRTRIQSDPDHVLATWDAGGHWASDLSGAWPDDLKEVASATPEFGTEATRSGAVDAHWGAGRVYDYLRTKFGRDSLDGHGMAVNSVVGATDYGQPYVNAFWDGQKMVYGSGDEEYRPLSAALDVVGHEMTHAVVSSSADLVYAGQSGAMNEAIADYFGNAIEADARRLPMDDPDSGLVGETLCRTKDPRGCAFRDLNDGRTTTGSFLGVGFGTDNGGVHLNSTVFSGALWDIREEIGPELADAVVYKALTEYLTPLDGFTQGRDAVLAAAKQLGAGGRALTAVRKAFTAHGIVPHWEEALGIDSDVLLPRVTTYDSHLGAGGGWWAAARSDESGSEPYSVWAGRTDGKGQLKLMSPNDGRYHVNPATDGTTVVWQAHGPAGVDILARPLAGGPVRTLWHGRGAGSALGVDGDTVTFAYYNHGGRAGVAYLSLKDPANVVTIGGGTYHRATFPAVAHGRIVYQDRQRVRAVYESTTRLIDVATGEQTVLQKAEADATLGPTAITADHVYWLLDAVGQNGTTTLRRAALDGSDVTDLSPETGPDALNVSEVTAGADAVTMVARTPAAEVSNAALSKLWQFTPDHKGDGTRRARVSCNRGEQLSAAAADGTRVVWLDATTGTTDVVTRARPSGTCA
ncbi:MULTISPECIES: M4 family metallopeptidase [Streptomyces]|uniref:M4 family metallopeptidase n=1 Tax=Streptomyces eurythermus TaxID=42237 RepID=A0ABW6Z7U2_9ACTN|nr:MULTISPECIES: M4 family metallopeptidase [Streptomyces]QIS74817.1 M4 family metallopeptidase [Streptomyces sp. DSM 40868]